MTAARDESTFVHHHPSGMTCVTCIVAGIDVAPSEVQAGRIVLAERARREVAA